MPENKKEASLIKIIDEQTLMQKVNDSAQTIETTTTPLGMLEAIKTATVLRNAEAKAKKDLKEKIKPIEDQIKLIGKYAKQLEKEIKAKALETIAYTKVPKAHYQTGEMYMARVDNLGEKIFTHTKAKFDYIVDKEAIWANKGYWMNKVIFERPFHQWVGESQVIGTETYIDDEKLAEYADQGLPMKTIKTKESIGIQWKEIEALIKAEEKDEAK